MLDTTAEQVQQPPETEELLATPKSENKDIRVELGVCWKNKESSNLSVQLDAIALNGFTNYKLSNNQHRPWVTLFSNGDKKAENHPDAHLVGFVPRPKKTGTTS